MVHKPARASHITPNVADTWWLGSEAGVHDLWVSWKRFRLCSAGTPLLVSKFQSPKQQCSKCNRALSAPWQHPGRLFCICRVARICARLHVCRRARHAEVHTCWTSCTIVLLRTTHNTSDSLTHENKREGCGYPFHMHHTRAVLAWYHGCIQSVLMLQAEAVLRA